MTVSKELLWKAYPDGFLAIRGVLTRTGGQCTKMGKSIRFQKGGTIIGWKADDPPYETYSVGDLGRHMNWKEIQAGNLLPNVDPTDIANWGALKLDLARAFGYYHREIIFREFDGRWVLEARTDGRNTAIYDDVRHFSFETDDIAEALVRAKIQALQESKEKEESYNGDLGTK